MKISYWSDGTDYVLWTSGFDGATDARWEMKAFSNLDTDTVITNGREVQFFQNQTPCDCSGRSSQARWDLEERVREHQAAIKRDARDVPF